MALLTGATPSPAQAATPGQLAETSKAAVAISVSVRPRLSLSAVAAQNSDPETTKLAIAPNEQLCLYGGDASRNYSVLLDRPGTSLALDGPAALARDEAATSNCAGHARVGASSITGFRLPSSGSGQPYLLLIAAE
jgi:hypothetical protein